MKWIKRSVIAVVVLLLVLATAAWWLLGSNTGLNFALARVSALTGGALQVQRTQGHLAGPFELIGVRYDDGAGTRVSVAKLQLEPRLWSLLRKRVQVHDLRVDDVSVVLPQNPPPTSSSGSFSLQPPVDLWLDHARVNAIHVTRGTQPLFAADTLELGGSWTSAGLVVKQLDLKAPDGHANLNGTLALGTGYRGDGQAGFAWKVDDTNYAGALIAHGDGQRARAMFKLSQPAAMTLQLDVAQTGNHAWTAKLDVPRFDPQSLPGTSSLQALAIALQGHGDQHGGTLAGQVDLNDYQLQLQPLRAQFSDDYATLTVQQLELGSPQIKGQVQASGVVQLDAKPLRAELTLRWHDLLLPPALAGQELASHGELKVGGSMDKYHASGNIDIGPPGKLAKLALNLDGSAQSIILHTLDLQQARGDLQASGTLTLQPALAWQATATAHRFDPGQLFAGWNGALDFAIASNGTVSANGPDATFAVHQLGGSLRQRAVSGKGQLHLSAEQVLDGELDLDSGRSHLHLSGKPGARNAIEVTAAVASLGDWLPNASGSLDGHFKVGGNLPRLSVNGQLHGQALSWQQQRVDTLRLIVGLPDISQIAGKLDLQSTGVHVQGLTFQRIAALAEGSPQNHRFTLGAQGTQLSTELAMHGSLEKSSVWKGTLSTLTLEPQGLPAWRLQQPAQLGYSAGALSLPETCLSAGDPQLCIAGQRDKAGNLDASYRLRALPLALLLNAMGEAGSTLRVDGTLEGNGRLRRTVAGVLSGAAEISSAAGSITYLDHAEAPLLRYDHLRLDAEFSPASQRIDVHAGLDDDGRLDGQVTISGAQQALGGQLDVRLGNLAFIELLSNDVANVKGGLDGNFHFAGPLAQPAITGRANVHDFAMELPAAGLKLADGALVVSTTDARQFRIDGSVQSGTGKVAIDGSVGLGANAQSTITLKGSQFTAVDIPAARVVVSPDLVVKRDAGGTSVSGAVAIDSAAVDVDKLPGAGATQASPDVVVVDAKQQQQAASQSPISAQVKVDLGRKTHLVGLGLDGNLTGVLTVIERPGRATTGQGQIAVNGTYRAYGQDLRIQQGQLLFASTPIANPGLNIRATRHLDPNGTIDEGQQVGLLVSGTAQRPILTVFSNPLMEQSDALSYLVTGKPLSQVKGGEGDMVNAAAQALGSAAGNLLAKSVGAKIGLDDIGVSNNAALGGNSAFTVGKYLSPRLYLSYGVGLFEPGTVITLRYRLSQRWNFEAQNATDFNRASFNYRIEK